MGFLNNLIFKILHKLQILKKKVVIVKQQVKDINLANIELIKFWQEGTQMMILLKLIKELIARIKSWIFNNTKETIKKIIKKMIWKTKKIPSAQKMKLFKSYKKI